MQNKQVLVKSCAILSASTLVKIVNGLVNFTRAIANNVTIPVSALHNCYNVTVIYIYINNKLTIKG